MYQPARQAGGQRAAWLLRPVEWLDLTPFPLEPFRVDGQERTKRNESGAGAIVEHWKIAQHKGPTDDKPTGCSYGGFSSASRYGQNDRPNDECEENRAADPDQARSTRQEVRLIREVRPSNR
jgi:hypothetical protein